MNVIALSLEFSTNAEVSGLSFSHIAANVPISALDTLFYGAIGELPVAVRPVMCS
jgi:hypothetical protein